MKNDTKRAAVIAALNDEFRRTGQGGRVVLTDQVSGSKFARRICTLVRDFGDFTEDNDPYGEHDFGAVECRGERYFWKIDYFDLDLKHLSQEPANAMVTNRVLTIMHSSEY